MRRVFNFNRVDDHGAREENEQVQNRQELRCPIAREGGHECAAEERGLIDFLIVTWGTQFARSLRAEGQS